MGEIVDFEIGKPHGFNGDGYSTPEQIIQKLPEPSAPAKPDYHLTAPIFLARLQELSDRNVQLAIKKNADYAKDADPFANFRTSTLVGVPVEKGMLVRMGDKLARVGNLLDKPAECTDESIDDTLADLANYATILRVWLEWKRLNGE